MKHTDQGDDAGRTAGEAIGLGSIVTAKRATGVCAVGETGVRYEVYTLDNRPGYGFIFERGGYDGFSPQDVAAILNVTGRTSEAVAGYQFTNVGQLTRDYEAGRFADAFPQRIPDSAQRAQFQRHDPDRGQER